jgi:AcrR family transcriptional regulator
MAAPAAPRTTPRFERKQQAVLAAAARLFNENGVRATTLADVARAVGLSTTSVTYYYAKRDALAAACFLQSIAVFDELIGRAAPLPTTRQRVALLIEEVIALRRAVAEGKRAPIVSFGDIRAVQPPYVETVFDTYTNMFRRLRSLFKGTDDAPAARRQWNARAHLLLSALLWTEVWLPHFTPVEFAGVAERICDIVERGLAAVPLPPPALVPGLAPVRSDRRRVSRETFLRAATDLINEQGYRGASVEKIAARLAVTKGAFYHHNDTKDALVLDCFRRTFIVTRLAQRAAARSGRTGLEKLWTASCALVRYQLAGAGPLLRSSALKALPQSLRADMLRQFERISDRFAALIREAIADGSMRPVDADVAAQLVSATINATAELHRWVPGTVAEEAVDIFVKPLFTGLTPPCD